MTMQHRRLGLRKQVESDNNPPDEDEVELTDEERELYGDHPGEYSGGITFSGHVLAYIMREVEGDDYTALYVYEFVRTDSQKLVVNRLSGYPNPGRQLSPFTKLGQRIENWKAAGVGLKLEGAKNAPLFDRLLPSLNGSFAGYHATFTQTGTVRQKDQKTGEETEMEIPYYPEFRGKFQMDQDTGEKRAFTGGYSHLVGVDRSNRLDEDGLTEAFNWVANLEDLSDTKTEQVEMFKEEFFETEDEDDEEEETEVEAVEAEAPADEEDEEDEEADPISILLSTIDGKTVKSARRLAAGLEGLEEFFDEDTVEAIKDGSFIDTLQAEGLINVQNDRVAVVSE